MTIAALQPYLDFAYIAAVVLFILSLKWLSSPVSARRGVLAGEIGAALAVMTTTAIFACLLPAWRASRTEPACVLRA